MEKKKVYAVATAHLDTVWRWNLATTIEEYITDTIAKNLDLIEKYPHYKFNFEGAFRYALIEEYYPKHFEIIKKLIEDGRWCVSGSSYENGDVNIPSPEALFRNILLGNGYFKEKFGKQSTDIFLPDCFGFGYALPAVMKHAGLNGFTTQKLSWGSAYGQPFDIGIWQGVDGSRVFASIDAKSYRYKFSDDIRADLGIIDKISANANRFGFPQTLNLYGTGDWGGSPTEESVMALEKSVLKNEKSDFEIISAASDEMFRDFEKLPKNIQDTFPVWNNELVMTAHGAGAYTSRAMSKRLNAQNENLADTTEKACVLANAIGVYKYPQKNINDAWKRVIRHQFHDDITGTSNMEVYNEAFNDYFVSLSQFKNEYIGAAVSYTHLHISELNRFGADITVNDRSAIINGVKNLYGANVYCTDLRGGASMVVAALAAEGKSTIGDIHHINRGYEKIEESLAQIGADIKRVNNEKKQEETEECSA